MKKIMLACALSLISFSSMATQNFIIDAFLNDEAVKSALSVLPENCFVDHTPSSVFLMESCAFIGCISDHLVSVGIREHGVNAQSSALLARVTVLNNAHVLSVKIISEEVKAKLWE